jgi:hypothetical protein
MADVRAVVPVVSDPLGLITASGQVWTENFGDGTLSRIDPMTSRATSHLQEVVGAASDGEDLWVTVDGNRLVRIDGATGQREESFRLGRTALFAPRDAGFLAVGHGSILGSRSSSLTSTGRRESTPVLYCSTELRPCMDGSVPGLQIGWAPGNVAEQIR